MILAGASVVRFTITLELRVWLFSKMVDNLFSKILLMSSLISKVTTDLGNIENRIVDN